MEFYHTAFRNPVRLLSSGEEKYLIWGNSTFLRVLQISCFPLPEDVGRTGLQNAVLRWGLERRARWTTGRWFAECFWNAAWKPRVCDLSCRRPNYHHHHHHHHHKHQGLDPLILSVFKVTTALTTVSSVFQLFSFLVVCSGMISKEFCFCGILCKCCDMSLNCRLSSRSA